MTKQEVVSTREAVLASSGTLAHNQEVVAISAEKVRESAELLGLRLGRLAEQYDEIACGLVRMERASATNAGAALDLADAVWCAFAGLSLGQLPAGALVVTVGRERAALRAALTTLGFVLGRAESVTQAAAVLLTDGPETGSSDLTFARWSDRVAKDTIVIAAVDGEGLGGASSTFTQTRAVTTSGDRQLVAAIRR